LAELVLPRNATDTAVRACAALHSGAFLAGDTANIDFHTLTFFLLEAVYASDYLWLEFVRFLSLHLLMLCFSTFHWLEKSLVLLSLRDLRHIDLQ
jgi:hypothetical protein